MSASLSYRALPLHNQGCMAGLRSCSALLLCLAGCWSSPPPAALVFVAENAELAIELRDNGQELVVHRKTGGVPQPVARARGVRLVLGGEDNEQLLPFTSQEPGIGSVIVHCGAPAEHQVAMTLILDGGDVRVEVSDQVELSADVAELSLAYELVSAGRPDEVFLPHVHPEPGMIAADEVFRCPIGFLRRQHLALAVLPDLDLLARERRLPQGLEVDEAFGLRHGLMACAAVPRGAARSHATLYRRDVDRAVEVRGETISFAHRLRVFTDATAASTLEAIVAELWQRRVGAEMARSSAPLLDDSLASIAQKAWARIAARWRQLPAGAAGGWPVATADPGVVEVPFSVWRQALTTACALLLRAERTGDTDLLQQAESVVGLRLGAWLPNGLCKSVLQLRTPPEQPSWTANDLDERPADLYYAPDAASCGYWLLESAATLPDATRTAILEVCARLANHLSGNQLRPTDGSIPPTGAIPALYDAADHWSTRKDVLPEDSADTAALALFLARYARATGDPDARRTAAAALRFLEHLANTGRWSDWSTRDVGFTNDPRSGMPVQSSRSMIFTVLAANLMFAQDPQPRWRTLALRVLEQLERQQQVWSPPWHSGDLRGGVSASNINDLWSAPEQALAARCFLAGYQLTSSREYLQRGAQALRASFASIVRAGDQVGLHDQLGTALVAAELTLRAEGQAIVDLAGNFAEGLDAVWFEATSLQGSALSFRLLSHVAFTEPVLVRFRNVRPNEYYVLNVNGRDQGSFSADDLVQGVRLEVSRVPQFRFTPPSEIRADRPRDLRAYVIGPIPERLEAHVEVRRAGELIDNLPMVLRRDQSGLLETERPLGLGLPVGSIVDTRLVVNLGGRNITVPRDGWTKVSLSSMNAIDVGWGREEQLVDAGGSNVEQFADGRSFCRATRASTPLVYAIDVPDKPTSLRLAVRVHGPVRIEAGPADASVLLHDDAEPTQFVRELEFTLVDSRLWRDDHLRLAFRPSLGQDAKLSVARIRYRAEGGTVIQPRGRTIGERTSETARNRPLRLAVVPLSLSDAPLTPNTEGLQQLFFGGAGYIVTPEPMSQRTVGSVRELLSAMSGGRSTVQGELLPPQAVDLPAATLDADLELLARHVHDAVVTPGSPGVDVIVAVHGVRGPAAGWTTIDTTPVVFLPQREPDGSFLSVGHSLAGVLTAHFGFEPVDDPDHGNFGTLALGGGGNTHMPSGPAGINLVRTGWAELVRVDPGDHAELRISPLQEGRALHQLPIGQLHGRGDLLFELRRGGPAEPGLGEGGLLLYWAFADGRPFLHTARGDAQPRFLRLSPSRSFFDTAFLPGDPYTDLVQRAVDIDGASRPSLATPQGEVPWTMHDVHMPTEGIGQLRLHYQVRDLRREFASKQAVWATGRGDQAGLPMATDQDRGLGWIELAGDALALRPAPHPHSSLRVSIPAPSARQPARIFGRVGRCDGAMQLRIGSGDGELLRVTLSPADAGTPFLLDLPATNAAVWLEVTRRGEEKDSRLLLDQLDLVPRVRSSLQVADSPAATAGVRLMDGAIYGSSRRLEALGTERPSLSVPLVLGAGDDLLRLVAGLAADTAFDRASRITLRLQDAAGQDSWTLLEDFELRRGDGEQPLFVGLLQLPFASVEKRVALLDVFVDGEPVHVVTFEVARP